MLIVCVRGGWGLAAGLGAGFDSPLAAAVVGFGGSALDVAGALPLSSVVAAAGGGCGVLTACAYDVDAPPAG